MTQETNMNDTPRLEKRVLIKRFVSALCKTDIVYVPYHAFFFAFFGAIGAFLPYLALYFKQLGLSATQTGVLAGVRPLAEIFLPLWGWMGDKFKRRKTILQLALVSYTVSALLILAVQPRHQKCMEREENTTYSATLEFSQSGVSLGHALPGHDPRHDTSANVETKVRNNSVIYQRELDQKELDNMFAIILLITVLGQIVGNVVFSFPEALLVALLEDKMKKYGAIRFLGEISIAISTFAIGAALQTTETEICGDKFKNYFIAFYCFTAYMAVALLTTFWMKTKYQDPPRPGIGLQEVVSSIINLKSISLLITTVFIGTFQGMNESFGLWFLDDLGGSSLLTGVAAGVRYSLATIGYITSQYVIAYFGVVRVIAVSMLSHGIVFCGISLVKAPWAALLFFALQGGLYSVSWCAVITHVGHVSQQTGYTASIQGVYSAGFWGLGYGGGTMLSGVLVQEFGIRTTYQAYAAVAVLLCVVLTVMYCLTERLNDGKDDVGYELISVDETNAVISSE